MKTVKIDLVIERQENKLWGRVTYNGNLITDTAPTVAELETKIKKLLEDFEDVNPDTVEFTHSYDIYALFEHFDFLKISNVAKHAGMNPALLRQYVSGAKNPSEEQARRIEETLHRLADEIKKSVLVVS
ncbi:hypothetical protein [Cyclobacterium xiamenense]|uniref:hypothetical protein n=1 Tax=Cyclobacterium xiamenense TaxID=1297121 RepID=UPI0035D0B32A